MVQPLVKPKIIKKHTKKFKRHQHDRKIAVKVGVYCQPSTTDSPSSQEGQDINIRKGNNSSEYMPGWD